MTQVNPEKIDDQPLKSTHPTHPRPLKTADTAFKDLFQMAKKKHSESSKPAPTDTKEIQPLKKEPPQNQEPTFSFNEQREFNDLFQTLGIGTTQFIEKLIVSTSNAIEQALAAPKSDTFLLLLDKAKLALQINIQRNQSQLAIKLTCNPTLHQFLSQHVNELKQHLRKKSIDVSELILDIDHTLEQKEIYSNKKNKILFSKE